MATVIIYRTSGSSETPPGVLEADTRQYDSLHFTDETTAVNVNPEAFDLMAAFAVDTITRREVREVRIVLLGDIFDLVRSAYWLETCPREERPWNGTLDRRTGMNAHPSVGGHFGLVLDAEEAKRTNPGRKARWII